ncbi:MAG TPA: threonine/serine dehydratase [Vicinamibacteria bacterium]|nr:threonine/serine dehydratase [Vicinamibacteria bacterium]
MSSPAQAVKPLVREELEEARRAIHGLVHRTPLLSSRSVSESCGLEIWLKAENLQKTGSFKPRGAFNKLLHVDVRERERGVVTASAGNHGQALAYVARHLHIPAFIVMPETANASKVAAVRSYGAEAILRGRVWDDAYAYSLELGRERGLMHVHPFKDSFIMAGQGTIALEILEDLPDLTAVIVPIGGGGLIGGIASAMKLHRPEVQVIGVEAEGAANMYRSHGEGRAVELDEVSTIADGLATKHTDPDVFALLETVVDDYVTVSDDELREAIRFLLERAKLLTEPSGAAGAAAALTGKLHVPTGAKTAIVLGGGNFDVKGKMTISI